MQARKIQSTSSYALILTNLGETYHWMGRLDDAQDRLMEALQLHIETGSRGRAKTLCALARVHRDRGELGKAAALANAALALSREPPEPRLEAGVLHTVGTIEGSLETLSEALRLARRVGDQFAEAHILIDLALLGAADPHALLAQARTIARACGYRKLEWMCLDALPGDPVEVPAG